jgi:hypothetical protein
MIDFTVDFDDSGKNSDQNTQEFHGLSTPPSSQRPRNHGMIWNNQHIEELDRLLKQKFITLEEIAEKFRGRINNI